MLTLSQCSYKNVANQQGEYSLPKLAYAYDSFEPFLNAQAMEIHHSKHHQTYINKLNEAIKKHPSLAQKAIEDILCDLNSVPEDIRTMVRNHGGGHANHSLYWTVISPKSTEASKELTNALIQNFSSVESFQEKIATTATNLFGSGWAWLCLDQNKNLVISSSSNQDSPLSQGQIPLFVIDVWEHAYYLNFQNRRIDFVNELVKNHIHWENVSTRYNEALKCL